MYTHITHAHPCDEKQNMRKLAAGEDKTTESFEEKGMQILLCMEVIFCYLLINVKSNIYYYSVIVSENYTHLFILIRSRFILISRMNDSFSSQERQRKKSNFISILNSII